MTSKGYKYFGIGKFCKLFKEGCLVVRGQKKTNNIYHLDGHSSKKNLEESKVGEGVETKTVKAEKIVRFL